MDKNQEAINILQELINEHSKLEKSDASKEAYTMEQHYEIHKLRDEVRKLGKALDKACEQLKIAYPYGYNKFNISGLCGAKEQWKEHFLKEE